MRTNQQRTGDWGERTAERYLVKEKDMRLLDRHWRKGRGELDLIMRNGTQMVFVEVRVRTGAGDLLQTYRSINRNKWRTLRKTAIGYLHQSPWRPESVRFDVIGILRSREGKVLNLTHWENVGVFGRNFRY